MPCAVAHPCDESALTAVVDAFKAEEMIVPILVGPTAKIKGRRRGGRPRPCGPGDRRHRTAMPPPVKPWPWCARARPRLLMKGSLHRRADGCRGGQDTGLQDGPAHRRIFLEPLFITNAAVNIFPISPPRPTSSRTRLTCIWASASAHRIAILSAMETVNPKVQGTLDAAALYKMADRGQIKGGVLDGPLAMDNAISVEATRARARIKGIVCSSAGRAQIWSHPISRPATCWPKNLSIPLQRRCRRHRARCARADRILTSRADAVRTRGVLRWPPSMPACASP
ncbi:MAG: phosphate acetyltransferase [Geminicoccaceae bacterium]